jgi:SAM-dependent methyltransferase
VTLLPEEITQRIAAHFVQEYAGTNLMPVRRAAQEIGSDRRAREQLSLMTRCIGEPLRGKRLLEIGGGIGLLQAVARTENILAFSVEPQVFNCQLARDVLQCYQIKQTWVSQSVGERLPFPDETFDVVCSFLVMEHVRDPRAVLSESIRVLRPGGFIHFTAPNYGSIWEGHYNVVWIPNSPPWLAKLYVRLLGRVPDFVDTLQLLTPRLIRDIVKDLPVEMISLGLDVWEHRLETLDFSEWSELRRLKQMVKIARRLGLVQVVRFFGRRFDMFTPIILTARKISPRGAS